MEEVSIQDFRANLKKYLGSLPLVLTQHGEKIATITQYSSVQKENTVQKFEAKDNQNTEEMKLVTPLRRLGGFSLCKKHKVFMSSCGCTI